MRQSSGRSKNSFRKLELAALKEICFVLDAIYKRGHINGFRPDRLRFTPQELFPSTIVEPTTRASTLGKIMAEAKLFEHLSDFVTKIGENYRLTVIDWKKFNGYHASTLKRIAKLEGRSKAMPRLQRRPYADIDIDDRIVTEHKPPKSKPLLLYLTDECDLYREPQEEFCYSLRNGQIAERILRFVSEGNNAYRPTKTIQLEVESMSPGSVRKTIQKINARATENLKLGTDNVLIQGRPSSGYRINPKYKIKTVKRA